MPARHRQAGSARREETPTSRPASGCFFGRGDYSVASGNLLLFGWAPITAEEADAAVSRLESQGWTREEAAEGYYVTEDATQSPTTDEDGYGMTYEFGDGWVTVADTKQGLLLIQRPAS